MTENSNMPLKGATAVGAAALVVGLLIAYTNTANLGGEGREDEDRVEHVEAEDATGDAQPRHLRDAAQALHPGRIVEMETKKGGRTYEIETIGADGVKWKMVFDAEGKLLRDEPD